VVEVAERGGLGAAGGGAPGGYGPGPGDRRNGPSAALPTGVGALDASGPDSHSASLLEADFAA